MAEMAEKMTFDSRVHEILAQIFIAFGQGAGTMIVSREAIRAGTRDYVRLVGAHLDRWDEIEFQTIEYARGLGRVAAHLAVGEAQHVILERHYRAASERFGATAPSAAYDCPWCVAPMRKT
jgi:hypothetical protein